MSRVVACDVGGTRLKTAVVDDGSVGSVATTATAGLDGPAVVALLLDAVRQAVDGDGLDGVGVAVPGIVDAGRVLALPGKFDGLVGTDLATLVRRTVGVPTVVVNDAVAAGIGEAVAGAGAGHGRVVVMTIGTGVGVSVAEDGRPLGSGPWGGGLLGGQIPIGDPDRGPTDTSGRRGTIEAMCAAGRLTDDAAGFTAVPDLLAAWRRGEAAAVDVVTSYRRSLEQALVALAQAHAPSALIVGGGPVSRDAGWLLDGMTEAVRARLWQGHELVVVPAALGDGAALAGVASLVTRARPNRTE